MRKATFKELYDAVPSVMPPRKTPKQAFIEEVAELTGRSETTVRMWLYSDQRPDRLAMKVIAQKFKVDPDGLFPEQNESEK